MEWKTAISHIEDGHELIRGYDLRELIAERSFPEVIYLVLRGELPGDKEMRMLNALFTAAVDHGVGVSSAMTARTVASTGNSMHTALAAGILSMGTLHGSAIEDAARFFQTHVHARSVKALVRGEQKAGRRLAGYGHKILRHDPRSDALFAVARETGLYGSHCRLAERILEELNRDREHALPLNVDGAMAAIASDMGFDWRMTKGLFIIGRTPGLVAHIFEEMTEGNGLRRLAEDESVYLGSPKRSIMVP
ncbi:hypothetical protein A3B32_01530 [Candidatus Uhrbacteria bacterium RIFCSPLOWO2_01_FULL_53_9]|uniref:citrate synthase (unknown stereospecificity) n=3 Tax=Candidatus Uhriibacteriota TaxID=1752732 RepID=A0A1F7UYY6_9BACT|nr:MAG: hypothetical protein A3C17_03310 [Candidatus Uhrbacteria bacterium RIFCSPHIGHO2_02_FULL_53_13]OGL83470.1 MAG: hypothetical protein A3B32_01530 [Candidatus Uhrbacteria bacterium RIFCSPLOWO2_01_FULL_53_9]OGL89740.1 MAG: hypothetical protein A3I45_03920 [Candidatus Uhrbacteria bacterium RIFCSPLOWO2_02_FULL_53_10]